MLKVGVVWNQSGGRVHQLLLAKIQCGCKLQHHFKLFHADVRLLTLGISCRVYWSFSMFAICGWPWCMPFPDFCMQITTGNSRKGLNYLEMLHSELCRAFHMQWCIALVYQTSAAFELSIQMLLTHYADFSIRNPPDFELSGKIRNDRIWSCRIRFLIFFFITMYCVLQTIKNNKSMYELPHVALSVIIT
jgi:hypothetical protein